MKHSLNEFGRGTLDRDAAQTRIAACWRSADHREGLRAHAEKRRPVFEGR
jgi:enoyl-CoA hydratase/carnithine racemase